eukprot:gene21792-biopygen30498
MSEAPPQVALGSPEVIGNAMSLLLLAPSTTSLLDLPTHLISSVVDILLLPDRSEGYRQRDIASFRLTCSLFNSLVLARATRMVLICPKQVDNFSSLPVRLLPNLQLLDLNQCRISPLSFVGMPTTITTLKLGGPRNFGGGRYPILDLSPLSKCIGLTDLDISSRNRVSDLSPLAACKYLDKLDISGCMTLRSLDPLANCTNLRSVNLRYTAIEDLCPLSACEELEMINCSNTKVSDLSPLSACLKLRDVNCRETSVSDLSPLSACLELRKVDCIGASVKDIACLTACPQLKSIGCDQGVIGLQLGDALEFEDGPQDHRFYLASHWALPKVTIEVPYDFPYFDGEDFVGSD